jgi:hypothetical protein
VNVETRLRQSRRPLKAADTNFDNHKGISVRVVHPLGFAWTDHAIVAAVSAGIDA